MGDKNDPKDRPRTIDPASQAMLAKAEKDEIRTVWDRWDDMQPGCKFGRDGICCRLCNMGPCRIIESSDKKKCGVCGATADTIAARNLVRMMAGGAAAHSDHGRDVAHTLLMAAEGKAGDYEIKDEVRLRALAGECGISADGKDTKKLAEEVARTALREFGQQHGELRFISRAPNALQEKWRRQGVIPRGIDREIVQVMHTTHIGVENDWKEVLKHGIRATLGDGWGGSMIATDLSDVLFGSPTPVRGRVNLGVLDEDKVNIVVHGHEPSLSEMIVAAARDPELIELAKQKGAKGINLAGMCCTANEILMRHGIPVAGNFLQQELAIATGAVDAMVIDVQCIMPALGDLCQRFHTKLVTTSPKCHFPGGHIERVEFREDAALETAKQIVRLAIENFPNRNPDALDIPAIEESLIAGFTAENVYNFLGGRYRATYRPLNNAIIEGRIRGLAGVVGCNNPKITHDYGHVEMAKELIRNDVLVVETGCAAQACAKAGLLRPETELAGAGLREVCEAVGIPPVLHVGSCVDCSRILVALCNVQAEGGLGDCLSDLPAAGAAPEWMSEKAVSIGFYVACSGVFTTLGTPWPVLGSKAVSDYVYGGMAEDYGGYFAYEEDPVKAAHLMIDHINEKREALKLRPMLHKAEPVAAPGH
ncbi:MAG: anaerobic carbon-monoxide dehydrogenase catalytic subunit [Planctomycetota bacterium]